MLNVRYISRSEIFPFVCIFLKIDCGLGRLSKRKSCFRFESDSFQLSVSSAGYVCESMYL